MPPDGTRIALGTAALTFAHADDPERGRRAVHAALEAGVRMFDTALAYSTPDIAGHAELSLRRALETHPLGPTATMTSKGGHFRRDDTFPIDGRPHILRDHLEGSLRRLGRDRLDVYLLHHPDPATPIEVSVSALEQFRQEDLVTTIGVSNVDLPLYRRARAAGPVGMVQNPMSLFRPGNHAVLAACEADGVAFMAYSPLGGSGDASVRLRATLASVARKHSMSPFEIALGWVSALSPVVTVVSGASRPETIRSAAAATRIVLDAEDAAVLSAAASPAHYVPISDSTD